MDSKEALVQLSNLYKDKEWYADVGMDQYGRCVVYIHHMCEETLRGIPDKVGDFQVLVHFNASKTALREQYTSNGSNSTYPNGAPCSYDREIDVSAVVLDDDKSLRHLTDELDKLERLCGTNTLQDIFYEVHDGPNAVTNLSARHPEVRRKLERLYDQYGFDVIYEEMDG